MGNYNSTNPESISPEPNDNDETQSNGIQMDIQRKHLLLLIEPLISPILLLILINKIDSHNPSTINSTTTYTYREN